MDFINEEDVKKTQDLIVSSITSDYKKTDMKEIARKIATSDLIGAYVESLNMESDFIGSGGSRLSEEYKEIMKMQQCCERWIAQRVLNESEWISCRVNKYYKKEKQA